MTEAGFGFDLGAEKFFDIKCAGAGLDTAAVVLVATIRALKMHGGVSKDNLSKPDARAVEAGLPNLEKHIENIRCFGEAPVIALNRFGGDSDEEMAVVRRCCEKLGIPFAITDHHARGGEGALDLARKLIEHAEATPVPFKPLYDWGSAGGGQDPNHLPAHLRRERRRAHRGGEARSGGRRTTRLRGLTDLHGQDPELALGQPETCAVAPRIST